MKLGELICIKTLDGKRNAEENEKHTPYRSELRLFSCIQLGDSQRLYDELRSMDSSIFVGKMSDNGINQYKYVAVSTVALAIRYAIQGGLEEKTAYDFSDKAISEIDKMNSSGDILLFLAERMLSLTQTVAKSRKDPVHSPHIKKCIRFINENIDKKITVKQLAEHCGVSSDYLSHIFKNETGENLSGYILNAKLERSKALVSDGASGKEIADKLGFSSDSHFATTFKRRFNMTPGEYYRMSK